MKIVVNNNTLKKALKKLNNTVLDSKRSYRDALKGINIIYDGNVLILSSTNSYILNSIRIKPVNVIDPENINIIVHPFKINDLKMSNVIIDFNELTIDDTIKKMALNKIYEEYPNINNLIDTSCNDGKISFRCEYMMDLLKGCEKDSTITITFNSSNNQKIYGLIENNFTNKYEDMEAITILAPCREC